MELEQRVTALEQEVKVLKNEIQATLLEIQEQILTGAYPALRAGDPALPEGSVSVSVAHIPQQKGEDDTPADPGEPPLRFSGVRRAGFDPDSPQPHSTAEMGELPRRVSEAPPAVRQVTRNAEGNGRLAELVPLNVPADIQPPQLANESEWLTFVRLTEWIGSTLDRLGVVRTDGLIDVYAAAGMLPPGQASVMHQMVALYSREDTGPEEMDWIHQTVEQMTAKPGALETGPIDPAEEEFWRQTASASAERQQKRSMILRIIEGIKNFNPDREEERG